MDDFHKKADIFVENLLTEGAQVPCDETADSFTENNENLPNFYDEDLFKKGQQFYHRNIFAVFVAKIFGLIAVLAIPTIRHILVFTKMSGSDYTAYKRYVATIFHMTIWYDSDFKPGSKLWKSISEVKKLHNSASKGSCKAGINRISQKDMALTQFGFMGFQLARPYHFSLDHVSNEEWTAFIHLWKVVGHLLGIEDRFNICRDSVEETRAICEKLLQKAFLPQVAKKDPEFLEMSKYLIDGLWTIQPMLNFGVLMCVLKILLTNSKRFINHDHEEYIELTIWQKCLLYFFGTIIFSLRFAPFRWYHNHTRYRDLWLMKNFPFLAYYKFGYKRAQVKILSKTE
ncbi:unnamed protein product [Ceutorhynchus assimilis]|uniref:ER-bound oxygenase mpaB/mpaB'/Rubber oxygenase catalytic domain-containing protein n=1 Tax=Ceutorhynchus assimilis TaxID=467358 RepID=A0A9N9QDB1_9CUCU|nr:unnamed protein product [Ceutorhynchus assimilis]